MHCFIIQLCLVMLNNARNKYSYEAIFVQLVICTVKDRFAGFSLSKSWFSNARAHLVPFFSYSCLCYLSGKLKLENKFLIGFIFISFLYIFYSQNTAQPVKKLQRYYKRYICRYCSNNGRNEHNLI